MFRKYFIVSMVSLSVLSCTLPNQVLNKSEFKIKNTSYQTSEGYNEEAYLLAFPDIVNGINNGNLQNGYKHFSPNGRNENRLLNPYYIQAKQSIDEGFNKIAYLNAFPPSNYNYSDPHNHYINVGKNLNYLSKPEYIKAKNNVHLYNENAYNYAHPQLRTQNISPYDDYITSLNNGLSSNTKFDELTYVRALTAVNSGLTETAYINSLVDFDESTYLLAFDDVRNKVFLGEYQSGYWFYINRGNIERKTLNHEKYRYSKEGFNELAYILTYADISSAINSGHIPSAYWHYKSYARIYEGRIAGNYNVIKQTVLDGFNEKAYRLAYPDILNAINNGQIPDAINHYLLYGINESRLNQNVYKNAYRTVINKDTTGSIGSD